MPPPARVEYVPVAPPPPRYEYVGPAPTVGYVWIGGYWNWAGGRHEWCQAVGNHPPRPLLGTPPLAATGLAGARIGGYWQRH